MAGPRSILIVGGGSAGWITAARLARELPGTRVAVVESPDVPTVSVGESMNPISRVFNDALGLDERAFMRACDATYKIAIAFDGFRDRGRTFFHPFGFPRGGARFEPGADARYLTTQLCRTRRFERAAVERYSYQIDANLYGAFLRGYAMDRGVERHVETISRVTLDGGGAIASVGGHRADLYVDCTGFRALLIGGALREPFVPIGAYLANDRAVAMSVPYVDRELEMAPFTGCTALSAGWVWNIPLWSRRGVGYVYSSRFLGEDEAERELREHLGAARVEGLACRHLKIRHGRHRRAWVKNCVAVGLASGFIEPLESTGISLTQQSVADLVRLLHDPERYNARTAAMFDTTVDFVQAHYVLTAREDTPYWRQVKHATPRTAGLEAVLEGARGGDYGVVERNPDAFYRPASWDVILSGMGFFGEGGGEGEAVVAVEGLPSHHEALLREVHGGA